LEKIIFTFPNFFNNVKERAGGVAQKCLPSNCEALSASPSTDKKKNVGEINKY
jgi:hypothetical protein